ncbi:SdrD B-like domain-containing protein [uncultured Methanolobus sp.]|uniref:SdrD B-like domain-containing protein n=1 Tax=uncultured Methanolobus sp. TaxID=218300 RepID=UPI0029C85BD3|nr:SdrD B-like domain-containing protein [uncultured Methanolobus sp.]
MFNRNRRSFSGRAVRITLVSIFILIAFSFQASACHIGDKVWEDKNANGIQDSGEPGIKGVKVELYKVTSSGGEYWKKTTYTDSNGMYKFPVDNNKDYKVKFSKSGYEFSPMDQGTDDTKDSDADVSTGKSGVIEIRGYKDNLTIDAGMSLKPCPEEALGDRVWNDVDMDGIQDDGELGIPGVKVELYKWNCTAKKGELNDTNITDSNGIYLFTELEPCTWYYVKFYLPDPCWKFSPRNVGDDNLDSDPDSDGNTGWTYITKGEVDLKWDAGMYGKANVGNFVWIDLDRDGIQDLPSEAGIEGVEVQLYSDSDEFLDSTSTDDSGYYEFTCLMPGEYYIKFLLPDGYTFSSSGAGDDSEDSDASEADGKTDIFTLAMGESKGTLDAGIFKKTSEEIPEFPTVAIPMVAIVGIAFVFQRRKE